MRWIELFRTSLPRPQGAAVLLASLLCAAISQAEPFPPDPVEELRLALRTPALDRVLIARVEALRSLGDMRRALALQQWGFQAGALEELRANRRQAFLLLVERFKQGVRQVLKQGTNNARLAAMAMLAEMGPSIRAPTPEDQKGIARTFAADLKALMERGETPQIKETAARTLGQIFADPDVAVAALRQLFGSPNGDERRAAADGLAALMRTVGQQTSRSEIAAAPLMNRSELIADITQAVRDVVPVAARALSDPDPAVRRSSAEAILHAAATVSYQVAQPRASEEDSEVPSERRKSQEIRSDLLPAMEVFAKQTAKLKKGLHDPDPEVRSLIARALEELGGARQRLVHTPVHNAVPAIPRTPNGLQGARLGRGSLRLVALQSQAAALPDPLLGMMQALLPTLEERVRDPVVQVRLQAIHVLETLEDAALPAVPALVQALSDPEFFVRWAAARTLGKMGPVEPPRVVPALSRLLCDRDLDVRLAAALALDRIGPAAQAAVPDLIRAVSASDAVEREAAIRALGGIGSGAQAAIPALAGALADPEPRVRQLAAEVLGRFGPLAAAAAPALQKALLDPEGDVRRAVSDALLTILQADK